MEQSKIIDTLETYHVAALARWRMGWRTEEAGRSGEVVVASMVYEWGNGGGGRLRGGRRG